MGSQPTVTPQTDTVPIIFDDGSFGHVLLANVQGAVKDGGKVAQFMHFDDGSEGPVPLERVHDAMKDGGQLIGRSPQLPQPKMRESMLAPSQVAMQPDAQLADLATSGGEGGYSDEDKATAMTHAGIQAGMQLTLGRLISGGAELKTLTPATATEKSAWELIRNVFSAGHIAGEQADVASFKEAAEAAYKAGAEASANGATTKAAMYNTLSMGLKAFEKYHGVKGAVIKALPLLPPAFAAYGIYKLIEDISDSMSDDQK